MGSTDPLLFSDCPLANVSVCPATTDGGSTAIIAYNNLGQSREEYLRLPVQRGSKVQVFDSSRAVVGLQIVDVAGSPNVSTAIFR